LQLKEIYSKEAKKRKKLTKNEDKLLENNIVPNLARSEQEAELLDNVKGRTVEKLAKKADVSKDTIQKVE